MQSIIPKLFIKNYKNTDDEKVRSKYGKVSGLFGIITNLILAFVKILIGILSSSVAILSDGINNLSDSGSSLITLLGFHLSQKKADSKHPFGHERIEYISGMIVSFIIIIIGVTIGRDAIDAIIHPKSDYAISTLVITVMILSIVVKFWQYFVYKSMGKAIHSETIQATAMDSLSDCISTTAVIISMLVYVISKNVFHSPVNIDGYAGVIVSIFIVINGIKLIMDTSSPLLGESASEETIKKIELKLFTYQGVLGIHDLVIHSYGPNRTFVTVHVEVDSERNIMESHEIVDNIERDFKNKYNIDLTIHIDPIDIHNEKTIELRNQIRTIVSSLHQKADIHDFRVVWGQHHSNVLFDISLPYDCKNPEEFRNQVIQKIKEINPDYHPIIGIDQGYNRIGTNS